MKKKTLTYLIYLFGICFILFSLFLSPQSFEYKDPAGYITYGKHKETSYEEMMQKGYGAYSLRTWAEKFFKTSNTLFPEGACAEVADEFLNDMFDSYLIVTEDFTTTAPQRVSSVMFGIEQEVVGALEMVYGEELVDEPGSDCVISLWSELVVRLPKFTRTSEIETRLYGKKVADTIIIQSGEFHTPIFECYFDIKKGKYESTCEIERTYEYRE